jgi:hypothetical protein
MHAMRPNPNANGKECVMAAPDIPAGDRLIKNKQHFIGISVQAWATAHGYDVGPAVLPADGRVYADRQTQAVFEARCAATEEADLRCLPFYG